MLPSTLAALVAERARLTPEAPALEAPGCEPLSYAGLEALVAITHDALRTRGVGPTDRVALALASGPEAVAATLSVACAAQAAPVDPRLTDAEAADLVSRLRPTAMVVGSQPAGVSEAARARGVPCLDLESRGHQAAFSFELTGDRLGPATAGGSPDPGPDDVALVLHTSGTTGQARIVPLTHANLLHAAFDGVRALGLTPQDRCLILRAGHHASGLVGGLLASLAAGGTAIMPVGVDPSQALAWIDELRPNWLTAAPAILQAILAQAERRGQSPIRTSLHFIRSSASPLPVDAAARLTRLFGVAVVDGYGMTEAPLIASASRDGSNPGSLLPAGPEIAIRDGEVVLRGPSVMAGYEDDPGANAAAFVDGWFRSGDQGVLAADGSLRLLGRVSERVNRGGEKVAPAEVEAVLKAHSAVADAAVFGVPHERLGEDVAAAIVRKPGALVTPAALRTFAASRLAAFKVPRRIVFCDAIPSDPQGKRSRARLAATLVPAVGERRPESDAPQPPDERAMAAIWAEALGLDHVGSDEDFFDLGGDSLAAVAIVKALSSRLGLAVPLAIFFEAPTVRALVACAAGAPLRGASVALRATGTRPPFFCVHGVGGAAFRLLPLARRLGDDQPFVALQAPGVEGTEQPLDEVEGLAALYLREVQTRQPKGPYFLGGFCMGAAVAFEMARELEAHGERVALLALVDPPPLPLSFRKRGRDRVQVAAAAAIRRLQRREAGPAISGEEPAVMQANRRALRRYRPRPYGGHVTLFLASEVPENAGADAEHSIRRLARGGVEVHRLQGGHMDLVLEPRVVALAASLSECLKRAAEPGP